MKEISQTIKNLGRENIDIAMEIFISASSKKERNMALAKCSSPMATNTKECGRMVLSMAKGSTTGAMEITIEVILVMVSGMEKVISKKAKHRSNTEGSITTIRSADLER